MHANICETYKVVHVSDSSLHPEAWLGLMNDFKWHELVSKVFFITSVLDSHVKSEDAAFAHVCNICIEQNLEGKTSFATRKALESHQRSKHGIRNNIRMYIADATECPSSQTKFGARLSLLAHLSDKRRPKCREFVMSNCPILDAATISALDASDNDKRKAARKAGRTHHIVQSAAINAKGIQTGRITF